MKTNIMIQTPVKSESRRNPAIEIVLTGMFAAVICVLSLVEIPTQAIPFTLGLFAIFLTGALLPPRNALLAVLVYLLIGLVGIPVFAGMKSGFGTLAGKTGGFLMSYPIMALIISLFNRYSKRYKAAALTLGMLIALAVCYLLGSLWFAFITASNIYVAFTYCVFPFALFDLIKIVLAISLSFVIRKRVMRNLV